MDFEYHDIGIVKGSKLAQIMGSGSIEVNSWHHQAIKDLGKGLYVVATAVDGIVEAIEGDGNTFVLGVQFHPEWHVDDGDIRYLAIFEALIEEGLESRK